MKRFAILLFACVGTGCSGSSPGDAGDASIDASSEPDASVSVADVVLQHQGNVNLQIDSPGGSGYVSTAYAIIDDQPSPVQSFVSPSDGCIVQRLSPPSDAGFVDAGTPDVVSHQQVNAGTITISGGTNPPVSLMFNGTYYLRFTQPGEYWHGGDVITVQATGATIPAFSGQLGYPTRVDWMSPGPDTAGLVQIDHTQSLLLRWAPGMGTLVARITTRGAQTPGDVILAQCAFDATAGTGSIPASIMSQLPLITGTTGLNGTFAVETSAVRDVVAGDYHMHLAAMTQPFSAPVRIF